MPKSRIRKKAKIKKTAAQRENTARRRRIKDLENMYADLKVHEEAALEVKKLEEERE